MTYLRHRIVFFLLSPIFNLYLRIAYHYQRAPRPAALKRGAKLILANHNCNLDPFMIAPSFNEPIYYVASDHLFRKGWISAIISFLVAPIPIVKSQIDLRTLRTIRETLAADRVVCLFPEGNRSFSGRTVRISPATGKLVRQLKCPLVLYRIHGGYLSTPRWGSRRRKGQMHGEIARVLSAEELAAMTPQAIQAIIEETLFVDAYEYQRQLEQPIAFHGRALAEHLERTLFVCPSCHAIDTLHSNDDQFSCRCGYSVTIDVYGFFHPQGEKSEALAASGHFLDTVAAWDDWQIQWLGSTVDQADDWAHGSDPILQDQDQRLTLTLRASHDQKLGQGTLALYADRLEFKLIQTHSAQPEQADQSMETRRFPLNRISRMIVHGLQTLQFSLDDQQTYEIHSPHPRSAYKYTVLFDLLAPRLKKQTPPPPQPGSPAQTTSPTGQDLDAHKK